MSAWRPDDDFAVFPRGARQKSGLVCPSLTQHDFLVPKHRYIFKLSNPRYPWQFWAEIIAYRIGCLMDIPVPPAFAAQDGEDGQPGALIEFFYGYPDDPTPYVRFVEGVEYLQRVIPEPGIKRGRQHNLRTLMRILSVFERVGLITEIVNHWGRVFAFDALIGNTDRHQENWGLLWFGAESSPSEARFSPAFDNGTALGTEIISRNLQKFAHEDRIRAYIRRGRHHIRWSAEDDESCGHIELVRRYVEAYPESRDTIRQCLEFDTRDLEILVLELTNFSINEPLGEDRASFILGLLRLRRDMLLEAIDGVGR